MTLRTGARHDAVVLDEADAILLDEARMPLVLAGERPHCPSTLAYHANAAFETLTPGKDFVMSGDNLTAQFTDAGIEALESCWPDVELFADDPEPLTALNVALHAHVLMTRDVDYVVADGRVWLVSPDTGRVEPLRRWPDGLQAAVEAKEGLAGSEAMVILDQIVMAELVDQYSMVTGMSATVQANADEIERVYGIRTLRVPPNRPTIRVDHPVAVYQTAQQADESLIRLVESLNITGRPVLVACQSVADSQRCSSLFALNGLQHVLLNAKNDSEEASVIAQAGQLSTVTVSTQMAGRGTDIRLSDAAHAAGGLYVIGRGNFPTQRLDAQLRGRAGRQGDPGDSIFLSSVEDDLVQHADPVVPVPRKIGSDGRIEDPKVERLIPHSQRVSEGELEGLRSLSWRYGRLLRSQRREVLRLREECMVGRSALERLREHRPEAIAALIDAVGRQDAEVGARLAVLSGVDDTWSSHLAFAAQVREGIHLRALVKEDPLIEFERTIAAAFPQFLAQALDTALVALQDSVRLDGSLDFTRIGEIVPAASWAYAVTDNSLGTELERLGRGLFGDVRRLPRGS